MKIELALADADVYTPATLGRIRDNLGLDLVVFGSSMMAAGHRDAAVTEATRAQDLLRSTPNVLVS